MVQTAPLPLCPICKQTIRVVSVYKNIYDKKDLLRCNDCGLSFIWPAHSKEDLDSIYTKEYYNAWSSDGLGAQSLMKMKRTTFGAILDTIARFKYSGAVLDIGCAFGDFLSVARERGWDVYGIELSAHAAAEAGKKIGSERVFQSDFINARLPQKTFDLITMIDVLEHEQDVASFLKRAYDLLKPGGLVVIFTPDMDSLSRKIMQRSWPHFNREHVIYFSRSGIGDILAKKGFKTLFCAPFNKAFNFQYIKCQIDAHAKVIVKNIINFILFFIPRSFWKHIFFLPHGEIMVIAQKTQT
jgi:2-polyprenyl-3-methyl-5-hydroxy-6-metoxy-1,4-benzoquinol methylase